MRTFKIIVCLLVWVPLCALDSIELKINIFSETNGKGLERDKNMLSEALRCLGCQVNYIDVFNPKPAGFYAVDINIFCQHLLPERFNEAQINWFIPNPEWYFVQPEHLNQVDLILCRTREVERIFKGLHQKTFFLGFTSQDIFIDHIPKDFSSCVHVAGGSAQKGTMAVAMCWRKNPFFPPVTVIRHTPAPMKNRANFNWRSDLLSLKELRHLQNQRGIHLCLSETEGYGHYLMEAMSSEAVVVTTDAPPMNEFIKDPRCLVPYNHKAQQQLATNYYVSSQDLEACLRRLLYLPKKELRAIGKANRVRYLKLKQQFYRRLKLLIERTKSENFVY